MQSRQLFTFNKQIFSIKFLGTYCIRRLSMIHNLFRVQEKIFHPLNAFWHAKELLDFVRANYLEVGFSAKVPIMFLYSSDDPDHQTTQICEVDIHSPWFGCLHSHSSKAELLQHCRACNAYPESWPSECCYCKRGYGTSKRN